VAIIASAQEKLFELKEELGQGAVPSHPQRKLAIKEKSVLVRHCGSGQAICLTLATIS